MERVSGMTHGSLFSGIGGFDLGFEWPGVPRVASGIPDRIARLRGLGNSIVPQIAFLIGRLILELDVNG